MGSTSPAWFRKYGIPLSIAIILSLTASWFSNGYRLIFVGNNDRCIPGYIFIVKLGERPETGQLAMFKSHKTDLLPADINIIKVVAGTSGDKITVTVNSVVTADKTYYTSLDKAAAFLKIPHAKLVGQTTVKDKHFFMLGTFSGSYDSRFFGQINQEQVVGRAYMVI